MTRLNKKKSDLDIITKNAEDTVDCLEKCFDSIADDRKTKTDVAKRLFCFSANLIKLTFNSGKAVVKQTPKAITTVAKVKREISDGVVNTYNELEKERLENEFEEKIKQLKRR